MTLNKYQKYNESVRLDDRAKEEILNRVMEADITPAKRRIPGWRFAAVFACLAAAFGLFLIPRHKLSQAEPAMEAAAAEEASESAVLYDSAPAEAAEAEAAPVLSADTLSMELGYVIPDMDSYSGASGTVYERISQTGGRITMQYGNGAVTILTDPVSTKEREQPAAEAVTSANSIAETAGGGDTVSETVLEQNGIRYLIVFDPAVSRAEAEDIEQYIIRSMKP